MALATAVAHSAPANTRVRSLKQPTKSSTAVQQSRYAKHADPHEAHRAVLARLDGPSEQLLRQHFQGFGPQLPACPTVRLLVRSVSRCVSNRSGRVAHQ